jgi:23S rRNA (uracil1939-C5)-methyltransferase
VFVPFALPGEAVLADVEAGRGKLITLETRSPQRREPISPYFTRCGGCVAQHMNEECYRGWKTSLVTATLHRAGIETTIAPLVDAHGDGRRRVVFHARYIGGEIHVGFMAARSHDLVDITSCPILAPPLENAPALALALAQTLASRKALDIQLTATLGGLDVDIRGHGKLAPLERERLVAAAARLDLARLSLHGDILVERQSPALKIGRAELVPPPGGFLQATALGEETLARIVGTAVGDARRVADMFAGCGPLTLRLAERAQVHAVDSDAAAIVALMRAGRNTPGLKPVTAESRDLFRRPLLAAELARFDAVVFDPPRAGAEAQARQIAASEVNTAVAVSCDTGTFARDANILVAAGFRLEEVTPVDQFRYSAHLELVGVLRRGRRLGAARKHRNS